MAQRRIVVGTTPVLLADYNKNRASISVIFLPTDIVAGNTGKIFLGKGFTPTSTVGDPTQGDILLQGSELSDASSYQNDSSIFKGQYWAIADVAGQVVTVDETSNESVKPVIENV